MTNFKHILAVFTLSLLAVNLQAAHNTEKPIGTLPDQTTVKTQNQDIVISTIDSKKPASVKQPTREELNDLQNQRIAEEDFAY